MPAAASESEPATPPRRRSRKTSAADGLVVAGVPLADLVSVSGANEGPRSKRAAILDCAVQRFGETGFEATKWSEISAEVGIGQTALYHYFESKAHCLLTIIRLELARSYDRFLAATKDSASPADALQAALAAAFDVSAAEMSQLRIVMANGDVLVNPRASEREEKERAACLALTHVIEAAWTDLLSKQFESGDPEGREPRVVALAVLGLLNSVWRWYRPGGRMPLRELSRIYVAAALRIVH